MRFSRIKCHNDPLMLEIDFYVFHSGNFLEHRSQLAHAFITIFAFGCDFDCLQDSVVGAFREKRIGWIGISWSRRVHRSFYLTCGNAAAVVSRHMPVMGRRDGPDSPAGGSAEPRIACDPSR